jgi:hypothetical protein
MDIARDGLILHRAMGLRTLNAFLLLLYSEGNALKLRFPQEIATLHIVNKGDI